MDSPYGAIAASFASTPALSAGGYAALAWTAGALAVLPALRLLTPGRS